MATISGITVERAEEIADASIVSAHITGSDLFFVKGDASEVNAGTVIPPAINAWPVGSIFMGATAVNPATLLGGGTWVRWGQGRVPVSQDSGQTEFDTLEETGGSKTHTLTSAEMPAHTHSINHDHGVVTSSDDAHSHTVSAQNNFGAGGVAVAGGTGGLDGTRNTSSDTHNHTVDLPAFTGTSGSTGSGGAHNNLQPYIVCYMWKRTA